MPLKKSQKSLKNWTKQKWRTKSGKPSAKTGERYLPEKAIKHYLHKNTQPQQKLNVKAQRQVSSLSNSLRG